MTLRTPIIAGNWKLNNGPEATRAFFQEYLPRIKSLRDRTIAICPPALSVTTAREAVGEGTGILLGVQNIHWESSGAFTGEISAPMAREAGASVVLVGHSERRHVFAEKDAESGRKVRAALDAGMTAVLCVGETLPDREAGREFQMVERQLLAGLDSVGEEELAGVVIAYEPVWAIGTGRTASPADASAMHAQIRDRLAQLYPARGAAVPILYGGSVKLENAGELLAAPGVDGLLIGGASLDPAGFAAICALGA